MPDWQRSGDTSVEVAADGILDAPYVRVLSAIVAALAAVFHLQLAVPMISRVAVSVATLMAVGGSVAHAEDFGTLPNGATFMWPRIFIADDNGDKNDPSDPDALRFYFNLAHCECSRQMPGLASSTVSYELSITNTTNTNRPAEWYVGNSCNDDVQRPTMCRTLPAAEAEPIGDIDSLVTPTFYTVNVSSMINGITVAPTECRQDEGNANIWVAVDTDANATPDFFSQRPMDLGKFQEVSGFDTRPPPLPTDFDAVGGEKSITISWEIPTDRATDLYYYQALCMDADTQAPGTDSPNEPKYQTTSTVCGLPNNVTLQSAAPQTTSEMDTDVAAPPQAFVDLDKAFICGDQISGTATSLDIDGLENGKRYIIALLALDQSGNATGVYFTRTVTPQPATDFWEDLHGRGSEVEGGFCLLAETYGDGGPITRALRSFRDGTLARTGFGRALTRAYYATLGKLGPVVHGSLALRAIAAILLAPFVVFALLWHVLSLPGLLALIALLVWRRRLLALVPRRLAFAGAALALLVPSLARADEWSPYWDEQGSSETSLADEERVKWHAGVRIGPYTPEIDAQAGINAMSGMGPYQAMFGNYYLDGKAHDAHVYQWLPMLDVDRVLWRGFGQLAVGGSLGYMQKSAYAYQEGCDGCDANNPQRPRTKAGRNTFRLIPLALEATYRLSILDDDYGIPVVPYVRGGLAYDVWWLKGPDGSIASVCKDGSMDDDCPKNKALGASLGVTGSVGVAIRAERIDPNSSRLMKQSGIYHAGFYGELSFARVDGFGSAKKLSVGDKTWFAGVDFEF